MKRFLPVALSALAIAVGLTSTSQAAIVPSLPDTHSTLRGEWIVSQTFRPPNLGSPPATAGGATRGGTCFKGKQPFVALLPQSQFGLTVSSHPTFFWYLPQSSSTSAQFLLLNQDDSQVVYETTLNIPDRAGVMSFTLPAVAKPLDVGQRYHWYLVINCNPLEGNANPSVEGWIQRTDPSASLSESIQQTPERNLPALYADQGIWYEALASLAQQRRANPLDNSLTTSWDRLLKSVGLATFAAEPLLEASSTINAVK